MRKKILAALGIIVNDRGQFLLTLRNDPENPAAHRKWEIPGGGVEKGETLEGAVIREVKEEIGVTIKLLPYPPIRIPVSVKDPHNLEHVSLTLVGFVSRIVAGEIQLDQKEAIDWRWVSLEDLHMLSYLSKTDRMLKKAASYMSV